MSLQNIGLKEIPERKVLYLKCQGPWRQLPEKLDELQLHVMARGYSPIGPYFGIYYNTPMEVSVEDLHWEICCPIEAETRGIEEKDPRFGVRKIPAKRMAATIHLGSFRKTAPTYALLEEWLDKNDSKVSGPAEEVYLSGLINKQEEVKIEIRLPVL